MRFWLCYKESSSTVDLNILISVSVSLPQVVCQSSFRILSALLVAIFKDLMCGDHVSLESNVILNIFLYFLLLMFLLFNLILNSPTFDFLVKIMQFDFSDEKLKPVFTDNVSK